MHNYISIKDVDFVQDEGVFLFYNRERLLQCASLLVLKI